MILGMPPFTLFHVLLSLVGIVAGFVVIFGMFRSEHLNGWTASFLFFTLATSVTGFLFPFNGFTPAIGVGIIATIVMVVTLAARYVYRMSGPWRAIFIIGAVISQYLNVFVLVVQLFQKVPPLHLLAPNGSEPPFAIVQGVVLLLFVVTGYLSLRRFHPATALA